MPSAATKPSRSRRQALAGLLVGFGLLWLWGTILTAARRDDVAPTERVHALALALLAAMGPLLGARAALRLRRTTPALGFTLRWWLLGSVAMWLLLLFVPLHFRPGRAACLIAAFGALGLGLLAFAPTRAGRPHRVTLLLVGAAVALLLGEFTLRAVTLAWPNPLWTRSTASSYQRIESHAYEPGRLHHGFPCNELGFYDQPFAPPSDQRRPTVAVLGDSFGASIAPHRFHYTTVAERALDDAAAVWNMGWASLGPSEYRVVLERETLPLSPDAVVVALFLGNDLPDTRPFRHDDLQLANWFERGNVLMFELPRRLMLVAAEPGMNRAPPREAYSTDEELRERMPWVFDPLLEPPRRELEPYVELETDRALAACSIWEHRWRCLCDELLAMRAMSGDRPFGVVLIPDEFMVEDALWQRVLAKADRSLDRFALPDRLVAWCAEQGIPCLDLGPVMRAEPALADGDRHLYHTHDTHWNVRGNDLAGRTMAPFLQALLGSR